MSRVLRIELRRSAALGSALILLVVGALLLYAIDEAEWAGGWMQLAMGQRLYLALLWPLALAAGAWEGRREKKSNVTELFASTPRPRAQRSVPTLGAMALAVVGGYLAMGIAGAIRIAGTAEYLPVTVAVVTAVGILALIAAAWFGLAIGRLLPWPVTAPALAVAGLGLLLSIPAATRPRGWLATVFSPIYDMNMPDAYATVPSRVSGAQALWLGALAVGGVLLFASASRWVRAGALLPLALGAALAIAVMPHQNRIVMETVDPVAQELVCASDEPRVCVSRVHAGLLPEVVPAARQALTSLAKLTGAPTEVHEDTTTWSPDRPARRYADVALVDIKVGPDGHLSDSTEMVARIVSGAFRGTFECPGLPAYSEAQAAAFWLLGREPVPLERFDDPSVTASAVSTWREWKSMPPDQAAAQVAALRKAAVACGIPADQRPKVAR